MPLSDSQINQLARAIVNAQVGIPKLTRLADQIDFSLDSIAPNGSLLARAEALLKAVNAARPPRDRELLEIIQKGGGISVGLKDLVGQLLTPGYQPPDSARDAV